MVPSQFWQTKISPDIAKRSVGGYGVCADVEVALLPSVRFPLDFVVAVVVWLVDQCKKEIMEGHMGDVKGQVQNQCASIMIPSFSQIEFSQIGPESWDCSFPIY